MARVRQRILIHKHVQDVKRKYYLCRNTSKAAFLLLLSFVSKFNLYVFCIRYSPIRYTETRVDIFVNCEYIHNNVESKSDTTYKYSYGSRLTSGVSVVESHLVCVRSNRTSLLMSQAIKYIALRNTGKNYNYFIYAIRLSSQLYILYVYTYVVLDNQNVRSDLIIFSEVI